MADFPLLPPYLRAYACTLFAFVKAALASAPPFVEEEKRALCTAVAAPTGVWLDEGTPAHAFEVVRVSCMFCMTDGVLGSVAEALGAQRDVLELERDGDGRAFSARVPMRDVPHNSEQSDGTRRRRSWLLCMCILSRPSICSAGLKLLARCYLVRSWLCSVGGMCMAGMYVCVHMCAFRT